MDLAEKLIELRDRLALWRSDRDTLADAANFIAEFRRADRVPLTPERIAELHAMAFPRRHTPPQS